MLRIINIYEKPFTIILIRLRAIIIQMDDLFLSFHLEFLPLFLSPPSLFVCLCFVSLILSYFFSLFYNFYFSLHLSCICSCVFFITHRIAEVSSTTDKSLDTIRDRRQKHRRVSRLYFRKLCHRHHHHCHHLHSPIHMHCPVVVGQGAGFPNCSGSDV